MGGARFAHLLSVVRGPIDIDLHGQYLMLEERDARKTNPVADGYGNRNGGTDTTRGPGGQRPHLYPQ